MMRKKEIRVISLFLALTMVLLSLTGCGSNSGAGKNKAIAQLDTKTVYKETASPLKELIKSAESTSEGDAPDSMGSDRLYFSSAAAFDGHYYVLYSDMESENSSFLCIFDEEGKNGQNIALPGSEDGNIAYFCVAPDGGIIVVSNEYDQKKEMFVWKLTDLSIKDGEVKEVWSQPIKADEDFDVYGLLSRDKEILLQSGTEIRIFDSGDGKEKKKIANPADFFGNMCMSPKGDILLIGYTTTRHAVFKLDEEKGKIEESNIDLSKTNVIETCASGSGAYDFYIADGSKVWGYKLDGSSPVVLMDSMSSNIEMESVTGFAVLSPDTMVLLYYDLDYVTHAGLFKKADPASLSEKKTLTLACSYADMELRRAILNFNNTSDRYMVLMKEYPYDEEGNSTLNMEISSGNIPDMLYIYSDMPLESYAAKGMFEDLDPYFSGDRELSTNEYLDNVIDAFRIDGKMYFISPSFYVIGMIGKKKDFGDTKGVTTTRIEKMISERNMSYDTALGISSREMMLSWIMYCAMEEYVDWDHGTCSFGSESFINLLKFCAKFPKSINYENIDWQKYEAGMREGRQILRDGYLSGFDDYMSERYGYVGEEITFMGYPGSGENGPVVQNDMAIALCTGSSDPDGCWEFLRTFYLDDYQQGNVYCFPVSKKALQIKAQKAMNPPVYTYVDIDGNEVTEKETNSVYLNDKEIKIPVPTQDDIDIVMEILENVDAKASVDSKISEIINEESGAFFAGQKSAEETADVIQSRVRVYIKETK